MLCQPKTCIVTSLVRPRRLHRHANFCSSFRTRCHKDALRLLKLLLANEITLISQSQSVYWIVDPEEVFNVPCYFCAQDFNCCQESRINTFTDSYPERLTHQLLKVGCSGTWNGRSEAISPMNTARLQCCFPVPARHHCVFSKTVFVGTFLHT